MDTKTIKLEDNLGFPWTASIGIGWIVLILAFTSGTFVVLLALYLALWISVKRHAFTSLFGFGASILCLCAAAGLENWQRLSTLGMWVGNISFLMFIASTFVLRSEIIRYYREHEGWNIEIGLWFTLFFSVVYINWCLNPASVPQKDTITSLNLK